MDEKQQSPSLSLSELRDYWKLVHALEEGKLIRALSIYEMPPWEDVFDLDWRIRRVDGGYFTDKNYGRRALSID